MELQQIKEKRERLERDYKLSSKESIKAYHKELSDQKKLSYRDRDLDISIAKKTLDMVGSLKSGDEAIASKSKTGSRLDYHNFVGNLNASGYTHF